MDHKPFPKMDRYSNNLGITITEKIDGTNGLIAISDDGEHLWAGSRNRWLTLGSDNYGFCRWAFDNAEELKKLGHGYHYGEWWGRGIERNYDKEDRTFSLFNVERWADGRQERPACCSVVPTLYVGTFTPGMVDSQLHYLATKGSAAAPGFMMPEGVIVYFHATKTLVKAPFNQRHKWQQQEATDAII